jgi:hypothetical protein
MGHDASIMDQNGLFGDRGSRSHLCTMSMANRDIYLARLQA